MIQDVIADIPISHAIRDYALMGVLTVMSGIHLLDRFGLLPERLNGNGRRGHSVGKMHVDALRDMIRAEVADVMEPVAKDLNEAARHLERIITILEERRR